MEWIARLKGKIVGLDTAPIIYFIERHPLYIETMRPFMEALKREEFVVATSTIALVETLVKPLKSGDKYMTRRYSNILLKTKELKVLPLSTQIAEKAAQLRATYNLHTPDAIQLATALSVGATSFLTNDIHLPSIPGLQMLVLNDLKHES